MLCLGGKTMGTNGKVSLTHNNYCVEKQNIFGLAIFEKYWKRP